MSDPLISIEHNGSTHARKASEWIALSRAALASPAAKIEEPDLIAEMREDAQDGRTTNKTVLDYIDALRAALTAKEKVERETIEMEELPDDARRILYENLWALYDGQPPSGDKT
jgi:hypothetical protein